MRSMKQALRLVMQSLNTTHGSAKNSMKSYLMIYRAGFFATTILFCGLAVSAQEEPSAAELKAQANNPLANMTAFNLHNYYIGETCSTYLSAGVLR